MRRTLVFIALALAPLMAVLADHAAAQQQPARTGTFFITSNGSGTGDVGGAVLLRGKLKHQPRRARRSG